MPHVPDGEIWTRIREEVARDAKREPMLASFLYTVVLNHARLERARIGKGILFDHATSVV